MNYDYTGRELCDRIREAPLLWASCWVQALLCLAAVVANAVLAPAVWRYQGFHANMRLLLLSYSLAAAAASVLSLFEATQRHTMITNAHFLSSNYSAPRLDCNLLCSRATPARQARSLMLIVMNLSYFALALERAVATYRASTYEGTHSRVLGVSLVACQVGSSFIIVLSLNN